MNGFVDSTPIASDVVFGQAMDASFLKLVCDHIQHMQIVMARERVHEQMKILLFSSDISLDISECESHVVEDIH